MIKDTVQLDQETPKVSDISDLGIMAHRAQLMKRSQELDELLHSGENIEDMVEPNQLTVEELDAHNIIYPGHKDQASVDAFREIRTRLVQKFQGENKVVMVSSVIPKGGATYNVLNMAAAFAFDHTKTSLLIDCNLKRPALHDRLYIKPQRGITDFLQEEAVSIDSIIYATGIARLRLIPVGQSIDSVAESFSSLRMKAFLEVVKRRYSDRFVFIDAPPISQSADARILANLSDYVVLVVPFGRSFESQVVDAVADIGEEKLAGVVFNN